MRVLLKTRPLAEHIAKRHHSQNAFAMKVGVSSGYMAQLLAGSRQPSGRVRERIQKATGMSFEDLFEFDYPEDRSHNRLVKSRV